ncbi:MAG TPA: hypothetical protein VNI81_01375, partial [Candidatus Limnocylindrales bacterium]|nr:hypothetical protein [Candidatus Limnocylindrales bacterium]
MSLGRGRGSMWKAGAWLLAAMSFAGCEDAAKRPVQAHAPALNASPGQEVTAQRGQATSGQAGPGVVGTLPVRNLKTQPLISLAPKTPGGIPYLIERVKEKFAAGEAEYKA